MNVDVHVSSATNLSILGHSHTETGVGFNFYFNFNFYLFLDVIVFAVNKIHNT